MTRSSRLPANRETDPIGNPCPSEPGAGWPSRRLADAPTAAPTVGPFVAKKRLLSSPSAATAPGTSTVLPVFAAVRRCAGFPWAMCRRRGASLVAGWGSIPWAMCRRRGASLVAGWGSVPWAMCRRRGASLPAAHDRSFLASWSFSFYMLSYHDIVRRYRAQYISRHIRVMTLLRRG